MSVALTEGPESRKDVTPTEAQRARRRSRSIAIAIVLGLLALMFYVVTIAKLGPNVMDRAL